MRAFTILVIVIAVAVAYLAFVRPWLAGRPMLAAILADFRAAEGSLRDRLAVAIRGWRTVLVARLLWLASLIVAFVDNLAPMVAGLDWTPVTTRALAYIDPDFRPIVISLGVAAIGAMFEWLRRSTATPVGEPSPAADSATEA